MAIDTIAVAVGPMDTVRADALAETVLEVAEPLEATVVLAHAFTDDEYEEFREALGFDERVEDVDPDAVAAERAPIPDLVDRLEEADVDYEICGVRGDHGTGVVEVATDVDADRIVVGGRRRTAAGKAVFGSTSQEVMESAPCPVTYARDTDVLE
ncbi:universal stress protein [Natrialbaceae archaeon AArc-T1-2]|uniref:universal stress protein n=1 Tax=Natrialbaceae archaeon AArc-T1-2 TaxID=3053904 RepID=UPI00255B1091|nr:universal stress protein [Natrialbaceae archaeon AArc-T1-2]WIV65840.1 universal stress protein [Natrialbaceae archaeon AArc-T1-2]